MNLDTVNTKVFNTIHLLALFDNFGAGPKKKQKNKKY